MTGDLKNRLNELAKEFQVNILEAALKGDDQNFDVLFELANSYTVSGRYSEGLELDRKLAEMRPKHPIVRYNLACSLSLLEHIDESLQELEHSFILGYRDYNYIIRDPDLENVRKDKRFSELVEKYLKENPDGKT